MLKKKVSLDSFSYMYFTKVTHTGMLPWESVKEPRPLGLGEGYPHAGHQRAMEDHRPNLHNILSENILDENSPQIY